MWKLAWRNVWRNGRRSVITLASIACGLAAIVFAQSMIKTIQFQLIEKATGVITGHLQIEDVGVQNYKFPEKSIAATAQVERVLEGMPPIAAFEKRILMTGLVSSQADSIGALIVGVEPQRDAEITSMHAYLSAGSFFTTRAGEIVMGDTLARSLGLKLGDKAVLLAQASDQSMGAANFKLVGIYHSGSESFDNQIVYADLPSLQEMLSMRGQANDFVIRLKDPERFQEAKAGIAEALRGLPVKVLTWREVDHELVGVQTYQNAILSVMLVIVFVIVALGILNTLLMSMFERVREFGVLRAIGARPAWILYLVVLESCFLGLLGIVSGMTVGSAMIVHYHRVGFRIPLADTLGYFLPFDPILHLRFNWATHSVAIMAVFVTCILAALAPAMKASRLKAADAIRHL